MAGNKRYNRNHRDANEPGLITLAKLLGAKVIQDGPLDWLLWNPRRASLHQIEIKNPECEGHADEYTAKQKRYLRWCRDNGVPWLVWRTDADVYRDLGARRVA